jgi:integrase
MAKTLTAAAVGRFKPLPNKRRFIRDGASQSLFLVIQPSGHKSWMMRFRRPGGGIAKLVLGRFDASGKELTGDPEIGQPLSLGAARALAADVHRQRARGLDVIAEHKARRHRQQAAIEESKNDTFAALARTFVAEHARPRTRRWRETARLLGWHYQRNDEPTATDGGLAQRWRDKPIGLIDAHDLYGAVDEARRTGIPGLERRRRTGMSDTSGRAMAAALSKMFTWLTQHRKIAINPAIGLYKPPPSKPRDRVLTDAEIVEFWRATATIGEPFGAVLRLLLLTGCRLREIADLSWSELSEDGSEIRLPGERTKNHRPHTVPLSPMAREIIESVQRSGGGSYVFSTNGGRTPPASFSKTKRRVDAAMSIPPWRLHDLRRTAVTQMAELGIAPHVIELCVNHISGARAGVAGVYNRSTMMVERRAALERWAAHVTGLVEGRRASVTPLRRGGGA